MDQTIETDVSLSEEFLCLSPEQVCKVCLDSIPVLLLVEDWAACRNFSLLTSWLYDTILNIWCTNRPAVFRELVLILKIADGILLTVCRW